MHVGHSQRRRRICLRVSKRQTQRPMDDAPTALRPRLRLTVSKRHRYTCKPLLAVYLRPFSQWSFDNVSLGLMKLEARSLKLEVSHRSSVAVSMSVIVYKYHLSPEDPWIKSLFFLDQDCPRPTMSQYGKINVRREEDFVAQTRARLETIKTHLESAPQSWKLKGKTCVITGAGSLKGIGSVRPPTPCTSLIRL